MQECVVRRGAEYDDGGWGSHVMALYNILISMARWCQSCLLTTTLLSRKRGIIILWMSSYMIIFDDGASNPG